MPTEESEHGPYEAIADVYDVWCAEVVEDIDFYVEACAGAERPIVEIGAGTGRIAIPVAEAGHDVVAIDRSPGMLARLERRAAVVDPVLAARITTLVGTLEALPPLAPADRILAPFRTLLHLADDEARVAVLRAIHDRLVPGGRFVFDVFEPTPRDIRVTHNRWIQRDSGVRERARWHADEQRLDLTVRFRGRATEMRLHWVEGRRWPALLQAAGLRVVAAFADFEGAPFNGLHGDSAWIAERPGRRRAGRGRRSGVSEAGSAETSPETTIRPEEDAMSQADEEPETDPIARIGAAGVDEPLDPEHDPADRAVRTAQDPREDASALSHTADDDPETYGP